MIAVVGGEVLRIEPVVDYHVVSVEAVLLAFPRKTYRQWSRRLGTVYLLPQYRGRGRFPETKHVAVDLTDRRQRDHCALA